MQGTQKGPLYVPGLDWHTYTNAHDCAFGIPTQTHKNTHGQALDFVCMFVCVCNCNGSVPGEEEHVS